MREIKFRAWCTVAKEMLKPFAVGFLSPEQEEDYHVQQYTGLKDKNGVEIYEGDIVEVNFTSSVEKKVITCHKASFGFRDDEIGFTPLAIFETPKKHIEVLGNIHENPELLEVEK